MSKIEIKEKEVNNKFRIFLKEYEEEIWTISVSILILAFLFFFLDLAVGFGGTKESVKNGKLTYKVFSLKSISETKGRFIIGTGNISNEDYYIFFTKDEQHGGYHKDKVLVEETLLIEKDTIPNIVRNFAITTTVTKKLVFEDKKRTDSADYSNFFRPIPKNVRYKYYLTVPVGTVTENQTFEAL